MKLDRQLNLVIPIYGEDEKTVLCHVHSTPISREVFERYFVPIGQTFSQIFSLGFGQAGGPRVAMLLLKRIAQKMEVWEGPEGVEAGLVAEIRRLTVVLALIDGAWRQVPLHVAVERGILDEEDRGEVENAIVFFIAVSAMLRRKERREMLDEALNLWGARTSSSTSTEFAASLPTSTATGSSGKRRPAPPPVPAAPPATLDGKPLSVPR